MDQNRFEAAYAQFVADDSVLSIATHFAIEDRRSFTETQRAQVQAELDRREILLREEAEEAQRAYDKHKAKERAFVEAEKAAGRFPQEFEAVVEYPDGVTPKIREGVVALRVNGEDPSRSVFEFSTEEGLSPVLPMKGHGLAWHEGWDIPTRWAIDGSGRGWMDNAHGGSLSPVEDLLRHFGDDEATRQKIREILGRKPEMPSWMKAALNCGWTPPTDFDRSVYED